MREPTVVVGMGMMGAGREVRRTRIAIRIAIAITIRTTITRTTRSLHRHEDAQQRKDPGDLGGG